MGGSKRSREGPEPWPLLVPGTCDSCTGASRPLRPQGRLGRPGKASRGGGGRGRARACQRVPGFIYDVRPMSLSAGLLGGWLQPAAGPTGRPPTWSSRPTPCPMGPCWGLSHGVMLHLVSLHLSLFLCVYVSISLSLCPQGFCPTLIRPFPPGLTPFAFTYPASPSLHPWPRLSHPCIFLPFSFSAPCSVCLCVSSPPALASLILPSPYYTRTWLRPQESGSWRRCGGGAPSFPRPPPTSPGAQPGQGRSWAAVQGLGEDSVPEKPGGRFPEGNMVLPRRGLPSPARAHPLPGAP